MGYQKLSIREAVQYIGEGRMLLPEIQRKFVWKAEQVENLFDSIMLGYPIGALLFWKTTSEVLNDSKNAQNLYKFIDDYHQRDNWENKKVSLPITTNYDSYYIVLDGQQRLSSLYIALAGSLSMKLPRCWWNSDGAFPKKELYMNLESDLHNKNQNEEENKRFKFLTEWQASESQTKWFKVKDIYRLTDEYKIYKYISDNQLDEKAAKNLIELFKVIDSKEKSPLNFYEIEESDYDDVLNIFVRVNSSGKPLSKTDLIFSTVVSEWKGGRDEIEKLIKELNGHDGSFHFDTDFVMRTCLAVTDAPISLKIESFKKENVDKIFDNWEKIKEALISTTSFLKKNGFTDAYITSYNALLPIIYYIYKGGHDTKENQEGFKTYFIVAQIKNVFGTSSNTVIAETRKTLQSIDCVKVPFSVDLFYGISLHQGINFIVTEDTIDRCFQYDKGSYTFMVLSLLYPEIKLDSASSFHQDHIHPWVGFENKNIKKLPISKETAEKWRSMRNKLPNLELLQGPENQSKKEMPIAKWVEKGNKVKFWPDGVSYDLESFEAFYAGREKLMRECLESLLKYKAN